MKIAIVGPVSAGALADHVDEQFRAIALEHLATHGTPVGALVRSLIASGNEVVVISHRRGHGELRMSGPSLEFVQVASRSSARRQILDGFHRERCAMVGALREVEVDVVHAHWTYEWALAAARANVAPLVVTVHDAPISVLMRNRSLYWLFRLMLGVRARLAVRHARLLAVSPSIRVRYKREMLWCSSIDLVPNVVDLPSELDGSTQTDEWTIVEIADSSRLKNIPMLLRAFASVHRSFPAARLMLIGANLSEEGRLANWARKHGLAESVIFAGPQDRKDVVHALGASVFHIHASREESFGLTVLESMALGVPVIAGRGSGGPDWLLAEGAGLLVDTANWRSMAEGMERLFEDPALRRDLARTAYQRYVTFFEGSVVTEQHLDAYNAAIGAKPHRRQR